MAARGASPRGTRRWRRRQRRGCRCRAQRRYGRVRVDLRKGRWSEVLALAQPTCTVGTVMPFSARKMRTRRGLAPSRSRRSSRNLAGWCWRSRNHSRPIAAVSSWSRLQSPGRDRPGQGHAGGGEGGDSQERRTEGAAISAEHDSAGGRGHARKRIRPLQQRASSCAAWVRGARRRRTGRCRRGPGPRPRRWTRELHEAAAKPSDAVRGILHRHLNYAHHGRAR